MSRIAKQRAARAGGTKVVGASLDEKDLRRLDRYIAREEAAGVRLKPGQALAALFRKGLAVVESEARA